MGRGLGGNTTRPHYTPIRPSATPLPAQTYTDIHALHMRESLLSRMTACGYGYACSHGHAPIAAPTRPCPRFFPFWPTRGHTRARACTPGEPPAPRARARAIPPDRFHFSVFRL
jgi:hypothetical protein